MVETPTPDRIEGVTRDVIRANFPDYSDKMDVDGTFLEAYVSHITEDVRACYEATDSMSRDVMLRGMLSDDRRLTEEIMRRLTQPDVSTDVNNDTQKSLDGSPQSAKTAGILQRICQCSRGIVAAVALSLGVLFMPDDRGNDPVVEAPANDVADSDDDQFLNKLIDFLSNFLDDLKSPSPEHLLPEDLLKIVGIKPPIKIPPPIPNDLDTDNFREAIPHLAKHLDKRIAAAVAYNEEHGPEAGEVPAFLREFNSTEYFEKLWERYEDYPAILRKIMDTPVPHIYIAKLDGALGLANKAQGAIALSANLAATGTLEDTLYHELDHILVQQEDLGEHAGLTVAGEGATEYHSMLMTGGVSESSSSYEKLAYRAFLLDAISQRDFLTYYAFDGDHKMSADGIVNKDLMFDGEEDLIPGILAILAQGRAPAVPVITMLHSIDQNSIPRLLDSVETRDTISRKFAMVLIATAVREKILEKDQARQYLERLVAPSLQARGYVFYGYLDDFLSERDGAVSFPPKLNEYIARYNAEITQEEREKHQEIGGAPWEWNVGNLSLAPELMLAIVLLLISGITYHSAMARMRSFKKLQIETRERIREAVDTLAAKTLLDDRGDKPNAVPLIGPARDVAALGELVRTLPTLNIFKLIRAQIIYLLSTAAAVSVGMTSENDGVSVSALVTALGLFGLYVGVGSEERKNHETMKRVLDACGVAPHDGKNTEANASGNEPISGFTYEPWGLRGSIAFSNGLSMKVHRGKGEHDSAGRPFPNYSILRGNAIYDGTIPDCYFDVLRYRLMDVQYERHRPSCVLNLSFLNLQTGRTEKVSEDVGQHPFLNRVHLFDIDARFEELEQANLRDDEIVIKVPIVANGAYYPYNAWQISDKYFCCVFSPFGGGEDIKVLGVTYKELKDAGPINGPGLFDSIMDTRRNEVFFWQDKCGVIKPGDVYEDFFTLHRQAIVGVKHPTPDWTRFVGFENMTGIHNITHTEGMRARSVMHEYLVERGIATEVSSTMSVVSLKEAFRRFQKLDVRDFFAQRGQASKGLPFGTQRRAAHGRQGKHAPSANGGEFDHMRPYTLGDDMRRVDQRALARTDRYMTRVNTYPTRVRGNRLVVMAESLLGDDELERLVDVLLASIRGDSIASVIILARESADATGTKVRYFNEIRVKGRKLSPSSAVDLFETICREAEKAMLISLPPFFERSVLHACIEADVYAVESPLYLRRGKLQKCLEKTANESQTGKRITRCFGPLASPEELSAAYRRDAVLIGFKDPQNKSEGPRENIFMGIRVM